MDVLRFGERIEQLREDGGAWNGRISDSTSVSHGSEYVSEYFKSPEIS